MSIHRSYFSKNDTIISNSVSNTGRNPITELFFGNVQDTSSSVGFTRFIFDLDLTELQSKLSNGEIATGCSYNLTHKLNMTNTSFFDDALLNDKWSNDRRRASSFDLILFRIPKTSGTTGDPQTWDEGVGFDYYKGVSTISPTTVSVRNIGPTDNSFSDRPSNWYSRNSNIDWSQEGIYDNTNSLSGNSSGLNYSAITIVDTQHFQFGNENIEFDMTDEINSILTGGTTGNTGWGIAFLPDVENISGLTENYTVGFFTRHTQTFYEPFLETSYTDLIEDDRNTFYEKRNNKLYLYSFKYGNPQQLDSNPTVDILDSNGDPVDGFTGLTTCEIGKGIYEVTISGLTASTVPCVFYDTWKGISVDGVSLDNVENQFVIQKLSDLYQIGMGDNEPSIYGFDFYGIKQDEKILNTDIRKVNVILKKAYTTKEVLTHVNAEYRIYVREGTTEVQIQDWTLVNRTASGYYFMFDTRDKIPNEYFVDIKVTTDKEVNTYKRELKFQIVNKK
jgi:hypothetical protein